MSSVALQTTTAFAEVPHPSRRYLAAKRAMDLVLGGTLLLLALPLLAVIAMLIVADSGRPVFFRQDRVGARPGRRTRCWELGTFRIWKFRTMVADGDHDERHREFVQAFVRGELPTEAEDGTPFKLPTGVHITRVGRWLRVTSLDELPQLFNVLGGSMTLVGPRPVPPYEVEAYDERHCMRLAGRPGITGLWQVEGRGVVPFEEMVDMDVAYLRAQSLLMDLRLLLRTVPCAFARKGAR